MVLSVFDYLRRTVFTSLILLAGCLIVIFEVTAATLKVQSDTGEKVLELQSGTSVTMTSLANGQTVLEFTGFYVEISDEPFSVVSDNPSANDPPADDPPADDPPADDPPADDPPADDPPADDPPADDPPVVDPPAAVEVPTDGYCAGYDPLVADCDPDVNFDTWVAGTGEKPYWIRQRLTEVFPFTLPEKSKDGAYGYLHLTTGERIRRSATEDIFHVWFSNEPNGAPVADAGCDRYSGQARMKVYWTQDEALNDPNNTSDLMCFLGADSKIMYVNFETRCYETLYDGDCGAIPRKVYEVGVNQEEEGYYGSAKTFPAFYDVHHVDVYLNGKKLSTDEFTAEDGRTVVLEGNVAVDGDVIWIDGTKLRKSYVKYQFDVSRRLRGY